MQAYLDLRSARIVARFDRSNPQLSAICYSREVVYASFCSTRQNACTGRLARW